METYNPHKILPTLNYIEVNEWFWLLFMFDERTCLIICCYTGLKVGLISTEKENAWREVKYIFQDLTVKKIIVRIIFGGITNIVWFFTFGFDYAFLITFLVTFGIRFAVQIWISGVRILYILRLLKRKPRPRSVYTKKEIDHYLSDVVEFWREVLKYISITWSITGLLYMIYSFGLPALFKKLKIQCYPEKFFYSEKFCVLGSITFVLSFILGRSKRVKTFNKGLSNYLFQLLTIIVNNHLRLCTVFKIYTSNAFRNWYNSEYYHYMLNPSKGKSFWFKIIDPIVTNLEKAKGPIRERLEKYLYGMIRKALDYYYSKSSTFNHNSDISNERVKDVQLLNN